MQKREFCGMNCILLLNLLETLDFFKRGGVYLKKSLEIMRRVKRNIGGIAKGSGMAGPDAVRYRNKIKKETDFYEKTVLDTAHLGCTDHGNGIFDPGCACVGGEQGVLGNRALIIR